MGKCCSRRRVSQVIGRHIYSLHGSDGAVSCRGNTLLHGTHFRCQCRLIAYGRRHTAQQGRNLGTGLGETEDIINEEQNVTRTVRLRSHVTEGLGYRQP